MIFSEDQYKVFNILINNWEQREHSKHPYFFLTSSAGTGKSFMIQQIVNFLINRNIKYLLMAPTGVAAKNVDSQTIHSTLHIRNTQTYFETLSHYNDQQRNELSQIKAIIIEEVSTMYL
ncbi:AAA family ATPase [Rhizophagus irregularis DAOM 181602=DAOM 197198]|nr:AAA family ATPase [Rhizophagus irregularis DAOM 181602=DAOM 197198]